jgi:hypothetical protein
MAKGEYTGLCLLLIAVLMELLAHEFGFGMLGRAELAFMVMDITFVQYHIMSADGFHTFHTSNTSHTLILVAFMLNLSVLLTISWYKRHFKVL